MFAVISEQREAISCVANCIKLGGDIDGYVETQVETAKKELIEWMAAHQVTTPPPNNKRKYTRRNLNPELQDEPNNTIKIYCEGTCSNIGKPDAKAGYGVFCHITVDGEIFTRDISESLDPSLPQSNQRAELEAIYAGISLSNDVQKEFPTCSIEIIVSSLYAYRCIHEWADMWKKKEWKRVKHSDILRKIVDEIRWPSRYINKDSEIAGYKYARCYAIKSIANTIESETDTQL